MKHSAQFKYLLKTGLPAIIISFALIFVTQAAFAQLTTHRSIIITPPTIEHTLNPGESAEGVLKITNNGSEELSFAAGIRDFIVEDTQGTPIILADDTLASKYSAASWLAVTPGTFTIPAGETKEINYYLQAPADATAGGHYAAAIYEPLGIIDVEGTGAGVNTQLGSLFYITIPGEVVENAEVLKFEIPGFSENPPVQAITEIKNLSGIHIRPSGTIIVRNMLGQESARSEITGKNIFPDRSIAYLNTLFEDSNFKFGRYTAELSLIYGQDNNLPLTATTSFIIFPWKVALGATLIVAIAVVIFFLLKRRKRASKEKSTTQTTPPVNS